MSNENGKIVPFRRPVGPGRPPSDPGPDPETFGRKPTLVERFKASPLTFLIAIVNIAYFVWIEKNGSSTDTATLIRFGAVETSLVRAGDYWRIASYAIVHIGWGHLLMNTWAGASWCMPVEQILGRVRFLLLYVLAGIGGGAAVVLFSSSVTAGASGAMFGIIGSLLTIRYRQLPTWKMFVNDRGVRSTVAQIALWTVLGIVALPMSQSGHFGGLITGALFTWVLTLPHAKRPIGYAGFAAAFLAFVALATQPWAKKELDWSTVKLNRLGGLDDRQAVLRAVPDCARGIERACVIKEIATLDLEDKAKRRQSRDLFKRACDHQIADACTAYGLLAGDDDVALGKRVLREACTAGSEWGCELANDAPPSEDRALDAILQVDASSPAASPDEGDDADGGG